MNRENGLWLYLWDGKEENLTRFLRALHEQGFVTKGAVVVPKGIDAPYSTWLPRTWCVGIPTNISSAEWAGLIWPDAAPQGPGWDKNMLLDLHPWSIVVSADVRQGDWRHGAVMFGAAALTAIGGVDPYNVPDEQIAVWQASAERARCLFVRADSQCPRQNPPVARLPPADEKLTSETAAALGVVMLSHGVRIAEPDYKGVRLQISTPSHSGKPEFLYHSSMQETKKTLVQKGVWVQQAWELYNADICAARSRIVAEFMRTDCTHLLMIDDDMGWETTAIDRLFYADKPVVAVAGPKKSYPLRFAVSHLDKDGTPIPISINPDDGSAEVSLVGAAFILIRRDVIEKMVESYPDLKYIGADSKDAHALFLPFIRENVYYQEDFAFCQRWADIGGKVYVCPDVPLKHIGTHVYQGDLLRSMNQRQPA